MKREVRNQPSESYVELALAQFERATRDIRWLIIGIAVISFPMVIPRATVAYGLALCAAMYNMFRYLPAVSRSRFWGSPATIISIDTTFIIGFMLLVGDARNAYSALLVLTVITAAYWYRTIGLLLVVVSEALAIYAISQVHWLEPIMLGEGRQALIAGAVFVAIGLLVAGLTRIERDQRDTFKRLNQENATQRSRLLALVNGLHTAVFIVDTKGKVMLCNRAAEELAVVSGDLQGRLFAEALSLHVRADPEKKPIAVLTGRPENQHRRDLQMTGLQGRVIDLDVTIQPVQLQEADAIGAIVLCEDITRERSLDEERSEFISVASHELRTPIAIMEAALSTLLHDSKTYSKESIELIQQAHDNSLLLGAIIKDLSMLAEAKNDNIPVKMEQIDPGALVRELAKEFDVQVRSKSLSLEVIIDPAVVPVLSTRSHIHEILQNYMTNAVKYSKKDGSVTLQVAPGAHGGVLFSVRDTGLGISSNDQQYLFHKFFRAEDYRIRETNGTGLGLYLCRELAQRLGGKVWCQSVLNKGSTFYLELPTLSTLRRDRGEVVKAEVAHLIEEI